MYYTGFLVCQLAEPPGNVVFCAFIFWPCEDNVGLIEFDHGSGAFTILGKHHHSGVVRGAGSLLHIVSHDDNGVILLEFLHQFFDLEGGDRVEG